MLAKQEVLVSSIAGLVYLGAILKTLFSVVLPSQFFEGTLPNGTSILNYSKVDCERFTPPDLIKTKHNSNYKTQQTTLQGKIIQEFTYHLLGFVPADIIRLKEDKWLTKLDNEQIKSIEQFLYSNKEF